MKFHLEKSVKKTDCLAVCVFQKTALSKQFKATALPKNVVSLIEKRIKAKDFEAKADTSITLYPETGSVNKVIVFGLGEDKKDRKTDQLRQIGASLRQATIKHKTLHIALPTEAATSEEFKRLLEGFMLGYYNYEHYKTKKADKPVTKDVYLIGASKDTLEYAKESEKIAESVFYVRDIINTPGSDMSPNVLEKEARKLSKYPNMKVTVIDEKKLKKMKAGAILAVGQGATEKSRMIIIEYKKKPRNKKPIAFLGKGVCFDTGGLNLKPTRYIEDMKLDMGGAATVLGIMHIIGKMQPNLHVTGTIGVVENAISKEAYKPGDVITALNGKSIEVLNTDAEGRLVLADCLTYTEDKYSPAHMIDFATLTGCALYTVGHDITPILGTDQKMVDKLLDLGKETDELMWQLPLYDHYAKNLKGSISDLNNTGDGVKAGTVIAALFLKEFINNDTPWVHCDIAGTAHGDKKESSYKPKGGRGVLLRTMWELLKSYK